MSSNSLVVILTSLCVGALAAIGPVADLPIVNKVIAPDGFSRSAVLAGGTFPGPLITARKGDRLKINVKDELTDNSMDLPTSIHWHGLFQKTTNYADGAAFVNQCPIIPEHSFLYDFDTRNQAGTYWYHSHYSTQYCDGLRGPIVIYDHNDPHRHLYDVDDESTVITLADWYHYKSLNPPADGIPAWATGLINGKGRYPDGPKDVPISVVNVVKGKRYRFRVVSISCDSTFTFHIDQHLLTIIEVDGNNVHPLVIDNLQIFAGQRYSMVLHANQPIGNYWIRSVPIDTLDASSPVSSVSDGQNSAILRYAGAPDGDPTTSSTLRLPLVETNLHPLNNARAPGKPVPGGADINIRLDVSITTPPLKFYINNATYDPPSLPALLQILSGATSAQDLLPKGSYYGLAPNKVVELVIPGGSFAGPHPVHLHGHAFSVVRSAGNATYNFDNPVVRDVVTIGDSLNDEVTIRFVTDNPGPWFFHCHIDWHLTLGFAVVFVEDAHDTLSRDPVPKAWQDLCPLYNNFLKSSS